ncbi:uncharacterized protein P174DRAFT_239329 [Aspergillus novofumigatus IBT 16806]|uniref:Uncharacterized protein n=1 Tax=Aspergillus novofumigatus (strain IBT 16806) TaxID=1392255 RepID=A0A2I1C1H1_ASPN1|nr:uncharacterized protein P174DRAFT_239329 [Aspergillus novofumigatus IBT 16806]PKX91478.1 hypothetical protein P174DRAFT_239329 [Aspergillus novofumigatus IBT 16806]
MRELTNNWQLPSIVPITGTHSRKYSRSTSMVSNSQLQYRIIAAYDAATYESAGGQLPVSYANVAMPYPRRWSEKWKRYGPMRPWTSVLGLCRHNVTTWCMLLARVRWTLRRMRWLLPIAGACIWSVWTTCGGCQCVSVSGAWSSAVLP